MCAIYSHNLKMLPAKLCSSWRGIECTKVAASAASQYRCEQQSIPSRVYLSSTVQPLPPIVNGTTIYGTILLLQLLKQLFAIGAKPCLAPSKFCGKPPVKSSLRPSIKCPLARQSTGRANSIGRLAVLNGPHSEDRSLQQAPLQHLALF